MSMSTGGGRIVLIGPVWWPRVESQSFLGRSVGGRGRTEVLLALGAKLSRLCSCVVIQALRFFRTILRHALFE